MRPRTIVPGTIQARYSRARTAKTNARGSSTPTRGSLRAPSRTTTVDARSHRRLRQGQITAQKVVYTRYQWRLETVPDISRAVTGMNGTASASTARRIGDAIHAALALKT